MKFTTTEEPTMSTSPYRPAPSHQIGETITGRCRSMGTKHVGIVTEIIWPGYPGGFGWFYRIETNGRERLVEA